VRAIEGGIGRGRLRERVRARRPHLLEGRDTRGVEVDERHALRRATARTAAAQGARSFVSVPSGRNWPARERRHQDRRGAALPDLRDVARQVGGKLGREVRRALFLPGLVVVPELHEDERRDARRPFESFAVTRSHEPSARKLFVLRPPRARLTQSTCHLKSPQSASP
jgi:hypothetical protein